MNALHAVQSGRAIAMRRKQPGGGSSEGLGLGAGIGMGAGMPACSPMRSTLHSCSPATAASNGAGAAASVPDVMTLDEAAAYLKVATDDVRR